MNEVKKVTLMCGDITCLTVDALVNSANKSLLGGGGLDYIVHKKAGKLMQDACIALNKQTGGCDVGMAKVTVAGNLPVKHVIHTVGPKWLDGNRNESQLLCDAYYHAMLKAEAVGVRSISLPNISTGVYRFPKKIAAELAIGTVLSRLNFFKKIEHVFFVCKDVENYLIYKDILLNIEDRTLKIYI